MKALLYFCFVKSTHLNALCSSDAIWRHRSESTLVQLMAWRSGHQVISWTIVDIWYTGIYDIIQFHRNVLKSTRKLFPHTSGANELEKYIWYLLIRNCYHDNYKIDTPEELCPRFLLYCGVMCFGTLHWRHNDQDGVSNHQPHGCLLNRLFRRRSNKTSKLRFTGLCVGNSPGPVNSPHKGPVSRKMFPFDDVIMIYVFFHILPGSFNDTSAIIRFPGPLKRPE